MNSTSGCCAAGQAVIGWYASKMGFHTGSCCFWPSTAKPMVGVCDVAIAPTMRAMSTPRSDDVRGGQDAGTASLAAMIRMQIRRGAYRQCKFRPDPSRMERSAPDDDDTRPGSAADPRPRTRRGGQCGDHGGLCPVSYTH